MKYRKLLLSLCASCLAASPLLATWPTVNVGVTITTASPDYLVPSTFVGAAFDVSYISGDGSAEALFDPNSGDPKYNPFYSHLQNLVKQAGITHIRLLQGAAQTGEPDPSGPQIDNFFTFANGAGVTKVIYSLHLYNSDEGVTGTDNGTSAAYIWNLSPQFALERGMIDSFAFDNEPDWKGKYDHPEGSPSNEDPVITGYDSPTASTGYKGKWEKLRGEVNTAIGATAPFSGSDTGSNYPVETSPSSNNTEPFTGIPWTVQFVTDEHANINCATQHYYHEQGDSQAVAWVGGGLSYYVGDVVSDPNDSVNPGAYYTCILNDPTSNTHPAAAPTYWAYSGSKTIWVTGHSYLAGDTVQDPKDSYNSYVCILNDPTSNNHPEAAPTYWQLDLVPEYQSANQLAAGLLNATRLTEWGTLYSSVLAGETISGHAWPTGLPFRLTESSPYLGGLNPANMSFATALWGVDYFHWWARHGCIGIDPFNRVVQTNAPLYQTSGGDFLATPYAYGMKAFLLGGNGKTIDASKFVITGSANFTGYGVVSTDGHHLYVTIINKTFVAGSTVLNVDLKPADFAATSASYVELVGGGSYGDISATTATLGGATIPTSGTFTPTWKSTGVSPVLLTAKGGGEYTLQVQPSEAVIVDLQK